MAGEIDQKTARKLAIRAAGLPGRRSRPAGRASLEKTIRKLGVVQIDSVNVFARSHYMPLYSRLGRYDQATFDRLVFGGVSRGRELEFTEYWPHCAGIIPVENRALFTFRMAGFRRRNPFDSKWYGLSERTLAAVKDRLAAEGPLTAGQLENEKTVKGQWWDWSEAKRALEWLFRSGEVAIAGRRQFQRIYALTSDVIPQKHLEVEIPEDEAMRRLVRIAIENMGIGTAAEIADYFRLRTVRVKRPLEELVEDGQLEEARLGRSPVYFSSAEVTARAPKGVSLLSPFDPLIWHRGRTVSLFGMDYRIEIYTPAAKRKFGYYSLPVLIDDRIALKVDLKADRQAGVLAVQSAWWHDDAVSADDAPRVAEELRTAARWLGLESISVGRWGTAVDTLAAVLGAKRHDRQS